jgi:uncharacterized protein (DUF2236 family)
MKGESSMTVGNPQPDDLAARPRLTSDRTRITIRNERTIHTRNVDIRRAYDFWAFAGGPANVIMQLSRPGVGYGVYESKVESGSIMKHPWKRARTTAQYLAVAAFGTDEDKRAYREAINTAHRHVRSDAGSPVKYNAFDRDLQLWVGACLYVGLEDMYQLLRGRMNDEQVERFYQSGAALATTLQVPPDMWPATRADFDEYWNTACEHVVLDDTIRGYLDDLINLRMINGLIAFPFRKLMWFLTVGSLAPIFREQMRVQWTETDQRRFDNLFAFVGFVNTFLPRFVRQGDTQLVLWDLRRRIRSGKPLI